MVRRLSSDKQQLPPMLPVTPSELKITIRNIKNKKSPYFDLITGVVKQLPIKKIVFLTMPFLSPSQSTPLSKPIEDIIHKQL